MTNKTQCPECFTVFMITDEQLIRSKGKVRCGNCRSTFIAQLMPVEEDQRQDGSSRMAATSPDGEITTKLDSQTLAQSMADETTKPNANSQLHQSLETSKDQRPLSDSSNREREPSIYKKYTSNEEVSSDTEISYRSDMLGGFSESDQDNPAVDQPNETKALDQKSDRLFSEAMQAIDDTPNFNLDDYTGSDLIEEQFGRVQATSPKALSEEPSEVFEEPSEVFEEPSAVYEEPSTTYQEPATIYEELFAGDPDEEPLASEEKPAEPSKDSLNVMSSSEEKSLTDAFSVIDDTPNFNIADYRESTFDNTESAYRETEEEQKFAAPSSTDKVQTHADQFLDDALSVINETPSFRVEDYSESTVDDPVQADNQTNYDTVSNQGILAPALEASESNDDALSTGALAGIEKSPSLHSADDSSTDDLQAELFDIESRDSGTLNELANEQISELDTSQQEADQILISEVDQLIEDKLVIDSIATDESDVMAFSKRAKHSAVNRWVYGPLLALVALLLIAVLGYQLWLKQAMPLLESPRLATALEPVTKPLKQQLQKYTINLPERRNLNQLELLSARTEAHPNRSSTILLRASLVNRANISQPFPWVELSLTDEDGRLVSRRALSPDDYLHNNRTENRINANELKQVTIELLTFPKQAHGFELRLLNK